MTWLKDLVALIEQAGIATFGVDVFLTALAQIPAGDGPWIGVRGTSGAGSESVHNQRLPRLVKPTAQLIVTAANPDDVDRVAQALWNALTVQNVTVNGTSYTDISPLQVPYGLPLDNLSRFRMAFNVHGTVVYGGC